MLISGVGDTHLGIINTYKAFKATGLEEIIWVEKSAQVQVVGKPTFKDQAETKVLAKCLVSKAGGNPENLRMF